MASKNEQRHELECFVHTFYVHWYYEIQTKQKKSLKSKNPTFPDSVTGNAGYQILSL